MHFNLLPWWLSASSKSLYMKWKVWIRLKDVAWCLLSLPPGRDTGPTETLYNPDKVQTLLLTSMLIRLQTSLLLEAVWGLQLPIVSCSLVGTVDLTSLWPSPSSKVPVTHCFLILSVCLIHLTHFQVGPKAVYRLKSKAVTSSSKNLISSLCKRTKV